MPSKPLYPSIKLAPLIINKKHKQTKNNEKISILIKRSRYSSEILSILNSWKIIRNIKKIIIKKSLNFGLMSIFRSSKKPKKKNNIQNEIYSVIKYFSEINW